MPVIGTLRTDVWYGEGDENLTDVLHELRSGLNVTFDETGNQTAGGTPEVEFTGPVAHLGVVAARIAGDDLIVLGDLLEQISVRERAGV